MVALLSSEPLPKKNKRLFAVYFWATLFSFLRMLSLDFYIFKMVIIFSQVKQRNRVMRKRSSTCLEFHKRTVFFFTLYFFHFILVFHNILVATIAPSELFKILQGKINFFELIFFKSYDLVISYCSFFNLTFQC